MVKRTQGPSSRPLPKVSPQAPPPPIEVPRLLTTAEAARVLGMKPQTLVLWRCKRRYPLRFLKMGGAVRYTIADLLKFLEAAGVAPADTRKARVLRRSGQARQSKSGTTI